MKLALAVLALAAGAAHAEPARPSMLHLARPAEANAAWGAAPSVIYLNRNGAIVQPGQMSDSRTNVSPLVQYPAQIPPFAWGDAAWQDFVQCVQTEFAPFAIRVTDVDPGSAEHIEAIVGGSPGAIGQPPQVAGYAASYCGVVDTNGVEFVFPDAIPSGHVTLLCEVAAQEIAHAFSLDHELLCSDPMSYCAEGAHKTFQDVDAPCGETYGRACRCGGSTQNSYRSLLETIGPSGEQPTGPMETGNGSCTSNAECGSGQACYADYAGGGICRPVPPTYQPPPVTICSTGAPVGFAPLFGVLVFVIRRRKYRS